MRIKAIADALRGTLATPAPRKGSASPRLDEAEFKRRFRAQFADQACDALAPELARITGAA